MSPCSRQVIRYFSIFHWLVPDKQTISPIGIRGVFFWSWCHSHCIMFDSEFWKWMDCRFTSIVVGSFHPFFAGDCLFNRCKFILMAYTLHFPPGYLGHNF